MNTPPITGAAAALTAALPVLNQIREAPPGSRDLSRDEGHALIDLLLAADELLRGYRAAMLIPSSERIIRQDILDFLNQEPDA